MLLVKFYNFLCIKLVYVNIKILIFRGFMAGPTRLFF